MSGSGLASQQKNSSSVVTIKVTLLVPIQTTSQTELENWITAIHSACAAAVARHHHKEDTLRLLKSEIKKLEQKIDMDEKMKKMGEMQLSSVTDSKKKKTILDQVTHSWVLAGAELLSLPSLYFWLPQSPSQ